MKSLTLNFYERISIWNQIGNYQAPRLKDVAVLLRVIEKIRPTDREAEETQLVAHESQMSWKMPEPGYGERAISLEAEEAAALLAVFHALENVRVSDGAWICALMERLAEEPVPV
jgi:hypothetical protein